LKFPIGSIVARCERKGEGPVRHDFYVVLEHLDQITTYFSLSTFDTGKQATVIFENRHYLVSEAEAEE
jgi:hypothetical protein